MRCVRCGSAAPDDDVRCPACAAAARKRAAALSLVREAYRAAPPGAAQSMLEHVLTCAAGNGGPERVEWYAGEAVFARLVLDHAWSVDDARAVFEAVRELGTVPAPAWHEAERRRVLPDVWREATEGAASSAKSGPQDAVAAVRGLKGRRAT